MQHSPQLIQSAIEEASRLGERNGEVPARTAAVLLAIRERITTLEADLRDAGIRNGELEAGLKTARDENARTANHHANQLIAIRDTCQREMLEIQDVATETIKRVQAEASEETRRLEGENTVLRMQLEAKSREVEGLSQAITELLSGIRANQVADRRQRDEVDNLLGGLMEFVTEEDLAAASARPGVSVTQLLGGMEDLVMETARQEPSTADVIQISRVA